LTETPTADGWFYPTMRYAMQRQVEEDGSSQLTYSSGPWFACASCHELMEKGDWDGVADRSLTDLAGPMRDWSKAIVRAQHAAFSTRRTEPAYQGDKVSTRRPNWADVLTPEQLEEGRKDRAHLLEHNVVEIRSHYREALKTGMERPVIFVADVRDDHGRGFAPPDTNESEVLRKYAEARVIPTSIVACPYGEAALRICADMTPNGRMLLERAASAPGHIPVVVIASHGTSYATVPEEGEFVGVVTPWEKIN
jgi:hypothetical protein